MGRLGFQSLWYDEGSSLFLARQSLAAITRGAAADIHPPLYYYLLHFWLAGAGQSEFALRFLSLTSGVLTVALLILIARRLFGRPAILPVGLLGAAAPLAVYYSQEARMYAQVTMFGLLATYLILRLTSCRGQKPSNWLWAAYVVAMACCLYSQYIGVLVALVQGLYVLAQRRRSTAAFVLSAGAAGLTFLPWAWLARASLLGWPSTDAFHAGAALFADAVFRYVDGMSANPTSLTIAGVALVWALCLLALRRGQAGWLPFLYLLVPLLVMFLMGYRKPVYNPKFALVALPGFLLLLSAAIAGLGRWRWPTLGLVLALNGYALYNNYANPAFARDDYRSLARYIATSEAPGDVIVLDAPGQEQIFPYYYQGALPSVGLPSERPLDETRTAATLATINSRARRVWLVLYGTNGSDPGAFVEHWLAGQDFEVLNQWFGNARL
ncbi:MAG: glycosyltransferase family 39 protein, partial [Chloroflexi bacterium]|nr:glycosyltransferase family 39 protein [Chloroflexota bacterium]